MTATPPTDQQLNEIDTLRQAATPGPWATYNDGTGLIDIAADLDDTGHGYRCRRYIGQLEAGQIDNDPQHQDWTEEQDRAQVAADAAYIAAMSPDVAAALVAEVRRLRAQVAATHTKSLATEADEIVIHCPDHGPQDQDGCWMDCHCAVADDIRRRLALPAEELHVVADDSDDPEHIDDCPGCEPATEDTLPAWLAKRFDPRGADWDGLSDDDRAYWEHQARAVRRAVARDGFKTTGRAVVPPAVQTGASDAAR